jgi:cytochrome b561
MNTNLLSARADAYDSRTIALHWLTALLVIALWTVGQTIDFFPRGAPRITARSLHISAGVLLGLLLVVRIAWRRRGGLTLPPAPGLAGRAAVGLHHLLYLLLAAVVIAGLASVWIRGDTLFNLFTVPAFDPANKELRETAVDLHGLLANLLLAGAGLHAAAALWHHHVMKDGVLRRMWPQR